MNKILPSTDSGPAQLQWNTLSIVLIGVFVLMIYIASVGPAFKIATNTHGFINERMLRTMYRPLFVLAPQTTSFHLRQWGVSDIEAFFVMQSPKGGN